MPQLQYAPTPSPSTYHHYSTGVNILAFMDKESDWLLKLQHGFQVQTRLRPGKDISTNYILLRRDGLLVIKPGYCWNGVNKPGMNTANNRLLSLIHDALCQLIREGFLPYRHRKDADLELEKWGLIGGMHPFRVWYYYKGVRLYAWWIRGSRFLRHGKHKQKY